jgi:integrase
MKGQRGRQKPHFVPLAPQTIALLRGLHTVTGRGKFLFPGRIGRPMSENTINAALRGMGYAKDVMSGHGFRASATSILTESNRWSRDAVEAQMAHEEPNAVRRAYARGEHWDERVMMMNWWADKVDELRRGGEVVPLRA